MRKVRKGLCEQDGSQPTKKASAGHVVPRHPYANVPGLSGVALAIHRFFFIYFPVRQKVWDVLTLIVRPESDLA